MSNKKISQLPSKNTPAPEDLLPIVDVQVDPYVTKKTTVGALLDGLVTQDFVGVAGGVAALDGGGRVPLSQLPAITITTVDVVASQAAMLALSVTQGAVAIRTDINKSFVLANTDPTTLSNWKELAATTNSVTSVNGQTGTVVLSAADVGAAATSHTHTASAITDFSSAALSAVTWSTLTGKPTFATVATSGSYNDLSDKPSIPSAYTLPTATDTVLGGVKIGSGVTITDGVISVSTNYAATSHTHTASEITDFSSAAVSAVTWSTLTGKPTFATVATSGSYNDLNDKPSIPSAYTLPTATGSVLGGVKIGAGITITDGVISAASSVYSAGVAVGSIVGSGADNTVGGDYAVVSGGEDNSATSYGFVGGGKNNSTTNSYSVVVGGIDNAVTSAYSTIIGGRNNDTNAYDNAHIIGSYITAMSSDSAFVNNLAVMGAWDPTLNEGAGGYVGGAIRLPNGTQITVGSFDNMTGGNNGISLHCAAGYELNWQGGRLRSTLLGDEDAVPQPIFVDSPLEFTGGGAANMEINATGLTFPDGTTQTTAGGASGPYEAGAGVNSIQPIAEENTASSFSSLVSGGVYNTATGNVAAVTSGANNAATGLASFVGGGGLFEPVTIAPVFLRSSVNATNGISFYSVASNNNGIVVALSPSKSFSGYSANSGETWSNINLPGTPSWWAVTYGSGKFVAISRTTSSNIASDIAATSTDGANWTQRTLPTSQLWRSIAYGNNLFVAISSGPAYATSPDGITWTARTLPSIPVGAGILNEYGSTVCTTVIFADGKFVALSSWGNYALTSTDGITWTFRNLGANGRWSSVTYGNGLFVAVQGLRWGGDQGVASNVSATSTDGITWTARTLPLSQSWVSVVYGDGIFVCFANNQSFALTSTDGITWTQKNLPTASSWSAATFDSSTNKFIVMALATVPQKTLVGTKNDSWARITTTSNHSFGSPTTLKFLTTNTLPAGLNAGTTYNVLALNLGAADFFVSTTNGGTPVSITDTGAGSHFIISAVPSNVASGKHAVIVGGKTNTASGETSFVGGGLNNLASGAYASITGGNANTAGGAGAAIGGGAVCNASGAASVISGGQNNTASQSGATIGGGLTNSVNSVCGTISGGGSNTVSGQYATISGGQGSAALGDRAVIGGGTSNAVTQGHGTIGGGTLNSVSGNLATISGGESNTASHTNATVGGGKNNVASGFISFIGGGESNTASAFVDDPYVGFLGWAVIGGGRNNTADGIFSSVLGGDDNDTNEKQNAHIIGSGITADAIDTTYVNNLKITGVYDAVLEQWVDGNIVVNGNVTVGTSVTIGTSLNFDDGSTQTTAYTGNAIQTYNIGGSVVGTSTTLFMIFSEGISRFVSSNNVTAHGITKTFSGDMRLFVNVGNFNIVFAHQSGSAATADSRFICPNNANFTLAPNGIVRAFYDGESSRWRLFGA